jgi:tetratricopeptide (TPR) repeat protein
MPIPRSPVVVGCLVSWFCLPVFSDALLLKDGTGIEGTIKDKGGELEVETAQGVMWVDKGQVKKRFGPVDEVVAQAQKDQERGRALFEEGKKIQEMEAHNAKLREAVKALEGARDTLADAQEAFATQASYRKLSDLFKVIIQEMRLYRDQFQVGGGAQAAKPPEPPPTAPPAGAPSPPPAPAPPAGPPPALAALEKEIRDLLAKSSLDPANVKYIAYTREGGESDDLRRELAKAFYERGIKAKTPVLADIRRAFALDPEAVRYYESFMEVCYNDGVEMYKKRKWNDAVKQFTLVIRVVGDLIGRSPEAKYHNRRAMSYQLRGIAQVGKFGGYGGHGQIRSDYTQAKDDYEKALQLDPGASNAEAIRRDLQNVVETLNLINNPPATTRRRR